jgi:hypothetical protein
LGSSGVEKVNKMANQNWRKKLKSSMAETEQKLASDFLLLLDNLTDDEHYFDIELIQTLLFTWQSNGVHSSYANGGISLK